MAQQEVTGAGAAISGPIAMIRRIGQVALLRTEFLFAIAIVVVISVLILPIPRGLMDLGLTVSIAFSVLILMTALFVERPLDFSAFPSILLIATVLRLALNIASTRLILSDGHTGTDAAGQVIRSFGELMMQGNFVIGIIVFAILVIVNFIVITRGSGRIAEVAARFTLDAMPGKQMAIDADLSAGLIEENEARTRRRTLEDESNFFGAMDGASKFVRGDAIAGILIAFINIIGGLIIGTVQHSLSLSDAASNYTVLTVGDGLVSQVPALIVSLSAGFVVSKSADVGSTDKAVFRQLTRSSALFMMGALTSILTLVMGGGVASAGFFTVSAVAFYAGYRLRMQETLAAQEKSAEAAAPKALAGPAAEETIASTLRIDQVRLELGYGLLSLINNSKGQRLTDQIRALRRQLAAEIGFVMPPVRIQDNLQLGANAYMIRIKEIETGRGELRPNMLLVMDPRGEAISLPGYETTEPTFGLPAMWIEESYREEALFRGYTVVDPPTVITTHLTELIKDNMAEMLSYAETQKLLEELDAENQKLIGDVIPSLISVGGLQRVLQNLLAERVSIRDVPSILEGIAEACGYTRNVITITEHVRARLARQISDTNTTDDGYIPIATLSTQWEQVFIESLIGEADERQLSMPPSKLQEFITAVRQTFDRLAVMGESPVLLTSPHIRPYVRSIIERFRPMTVVMSQNEIYPKARIKTIGQV